MPVRRFQLLAFEDIMLLQADLLEEGSLHWLLCQHAELLFPGWLFAGWKGESTLGRDAWPAPTLMGLLLLRYSEEGTTRVGSLRRAKHDAQWRAALRLPWGVKPPHEKTMREFEAFLKIDHPVVGEPRFLVVFEHWFRLCLEGGIVGDEVLVVIVSTPMWCY
ncbi:MAG: transposase, partial [Actinomycetia bacterium]|nr:transposase [Actinomycetes bacterium]